MQMDLSAIRVIKEFRGQLDCLVQTGAGANQDKEEILDQAEMMVHRVHMDCRVTLVQPEELVDRVRLVRLDLPVPRVERTTPLRTFSRQLGVTFKDQRDRIRFWEMMVKWLKTI